MLVETPGRGKRQSLGPQSSPERKKLGDAARVARARAEIAVAMAGAASCPAASEGPRAQSALAASRKRPAEVSARPLTPPPTSSASPPRTPASLCRRPAAQLRGWVPDEGSLQRAVLWFLRAQPVQCSMDRAYSYLKLPRGSGWCLLKQRAKGTQGGLKRQSFGVVLDPAGT